MAPFPAACAQGTLPAPCGLMGGAAQGTLPCRVCPGDAPSSLVLPRCLRCLQMAAMLLSQSSKQHFPLMPKQGALGFCSLRENCIQGLATELSAKLGCVTASRSKFQAATVRRANRKVPGLYTEPRTTRSWLLASECLQGFSAPVLSHVRPERKPGRRPGCTGSLVCSDTVLTWSKEAALLHTQTHTVINTCTRGTQSCAHPCNTGTVHAHTQSSPHAHVACIVHTHAHLCADTRGPSRPGRLLTAGPGLRAQRRARELEEKCRAQSEHFILLSRDLGRLREHAGEIDLQGGSSLDVPSSPGKPFRSFMNGLAPSIGKGKRLGRPTSSLPPSLPRTAAGMEKGRWQGSGVEACDRASHHTQGGDQPSRPWGGTGQPASPTSTPHARPRPKPLTGADQRGFAHVLRPVLQTTRVEGLSGSPSRAVSRDSAPGVWLWGLGWDLPGGLLSFPCFPSFHPVTSC